MKSDSLYYKVYKNLPIFLQNAVTSLKGYQQRYQRYGEPFRKKLDFLKQSEWWSESEIETYQQEQLQEIIEHAYHHVPYYRNLMEELNLEPEDIRKKEDLKKLPKLTKEDVRQNIDQLISTDFNKKQLIKSSTSGTTGKALEFYLTREAISFQRAVWWRHKARFGLEFGDRHLIFGARPVAPIGQSEPPYWRYIKPINKVYLPMYHIKSDNIKEIVSWLNEESFDFYTGHASALNLLATSIEEKQLKLINRPKYIVTGADALLPTFEKNIKQAFGVPITEQYGFAEACGNFSKCELGNFHHDFEFGMVELAPIDGISDERQYKLLFTGFANPAMPLIRYKVGDVGRLTKSSCSCGRESLTLQSIDGRVVDYVVTPDGRRVMGMDQAFKRAPDAREMQIVQNQKDKIIVKVIPRDGFGSENKSKVLSELRSRLGEEIEIEFKLVDKIPRGNSGKFRAVVSNIE